MIIAKTEAGLKVMKDRSVPLTPRQRSVFILIDGRRTLEELLTASAAMGVLPADIEQLFELGLVADAAPAQVSAALNGAAIVPETLVEQGARTPMQRYQDAYPIAAKLTGSLGLKGFRLNLAVEAAGNYEQLLELAPRIREAVGRDQFKALEHALNGH